MTSKRVSAMVIVVGFLLGLVLSGQLPSKIPIHWGLSGTVDGYADPVLAVWLLPAIALGVFLILSNLRRLDPIRANYVQFEGTIGRFTLAIISFLMALHILILINGLGWDVNVPRIVLVLVGILFASLGNELGRLRPNSFVGIRVPWTLNNEDVWRQSHRVGGRIMVLSGLVIALASLVSPLTIIVWVIQLVIFVMAAGMIGYSYYYALQKRQASEN